MQTLTGIDTSTSIDGLKTRIRDYLLGIYTCPGRRNLATGERVECGRRYSHKNMKEIPRSGWLDSGSAYSFPHTHCGECGKVLPV